MTDPVATSLQFESLRKSYGSKEVLKGFSGTFSAGRIAALVGPNGAGKTTLLRIASGLQHADGGSVRGSRALYYGGFDTLPVKGRINEFRYALGLGPLEEGGRKMSTLSRGELHQVGLDAVLELKPEALLLDEPWTALEPDARERLSGQLRLMAPGRVIVCSSHDLDEVARVADDLVFLRDGTGLWKRREDGFSSRDELLRLFRGSSVR